MKHRESRMGRSVYKSSAKRVSSAAMVQEYWISYRSSAASTAATSPRVEPIDKHDAPRDSTGYDVAAEYERRYCG